MSIPVIATKLYLPVPRPDRVSRERLLARLDSSIGAKLILVSAPAGFGKTTLVCDWLNRLNRPISWLSLDDEDSDLQRFLSYLVAAIQTFSPNVANQLAAALQSPQPPDVEPLLITLINEMARLPDGGVLVLDDYHLIDSSSVDQALAFLLQHLPAHFQLVIITREDPQLPLASLRASNQMVELRASELRFNHEEANLFLNEKMSLKLSDKSISLLEERTEGWAVGLQLAAISLRDEKDTQAFVSSFSGSHRFVLDYLLEEVWRRQPASLRAFLLSSSVTERVCASLCEALFPQTEKPAQQILEYLEHSNLFLVPLDNDRKWYRYHHLFGDLLRQRLRAGELVDGFSIANESELHSRASHWYEENGLPLDAFLHAVQAQDVDSAARLVVGDGQPLHFRGAITPVLNWLSSLPEETLDSKPELWVMYASAAMFAGRSDGMETLLQRAESAVQEKGQQNSELAGHIAAIRALIAAPAYKVSEMIREAKLALSLLPEHNLLIRTSAIFTLGLAYQFENNPTEARKAYETALPLSQRSGNLLVHMGTLTCLGQLEEAERAPETARDYYLQVIELAGDPPLPIVCEAYLGLARLAFDVRDLVKARDYVIRAFDLAKLVDNINTPANCLVLLARIILAEGDVEGAKQELANMSRYVRQPNDAELMAAAQVCRQEIESFSGQQSTEISRNWPQGFIEPLTKKEMAVLQLIAQGLSNQEIGARLFLALSTVKGHNRAIFSKLQVQRRTEAVAKARELGII